MARIIDPARSPWRDTPVDPSTVAKYDGKSTPAMPKPIAATSHGVRLVRAPNRDTTMKAPQMLPVKEGRRVHRGRSRSATTAASAISPEKRMRQG
jgi:hypothetical protein